MVLLVLLYWLYPGVLRMLGLDTAAEIVLSVSIDPVDWQPDRVCAGSCCNRSVRRALAEKLRLVCVRKRRSVPPTCREFLS